MCVGGANVDRKAKTIAQFEKGTSNPGRLTTSSGGVARNVAEALARLGAKVSLVTVFGDDADGAWLKKTTARAGVYLGHSTILPSRRTGTYTAILDCSGELQASVSDMALYDSLDFGFIEKKWLKIEEGDIVFMDTNFSAEVIEYIIGQSLDRGKQLIVNPVSTHKTKKLPDNLSGIDLILPNRDEAAVLSGIDIKTPDDAIEAGRQIRKRGAARALISLGAEGQCIVTDEESRHIPVLMTDVIDVTGAGDSHSAGVIFGLSTGKSLEVSAKLGTAAAIQALRSKHAVHPELSADKLYKLTGEPA